MKFINSIYDLLLEEVESYRFRLESEDPFLYKYTFQDVIGNEYLVEFKNISVNKVGELSNIYELLYYVKDKENYTVYKIVNVNPYRVIKTVFGDIVNDFSNRCRFVKEIFFVGLAKEREKEYVTSRTRIYKRYLDMNPPEGFRVRQNGNLIQLRRI